MCPLLGVILNPFNLSLRFPFIVVHKENSSWFVYDFIVYV